MMDEKNAISVQHVYKSFRLPHERADSIKSVFTNPFASRHRKYERQHALDDINFDVKKGEFFGIVGRNGSGKSTLLKVIAGIYRPDKGSVKLDGRLVPFIELGVGFNPELSGRENVYLNGALLGFSEKEVTKKYRAIVDFAEIDRFMDQKLKNYSSGMQVRLAFSVATVLAESDILLIDEVLAVGDADFQKKCFDYFRQLKKDKKTVVFVSHDMNAVKEYCDRAILIDKSKVVFSGTAEEAAKKYNKLFVNKEKAAQVPGRTSEKWGEGGVDISSIHSDKPLYDQSDQTVQISYVVKAVSDIDDSLMFGLTIKNAAGQAICGTNSAIVGHRKNIRLGKGESLMVSWTVPNIFNEGTYTVEPAVDAVESKRLLMWWDDAYRFKVRNEQKTPYIVAPHIDLSLSST